jgi:hypothetical protein
MHRARRFMKGYVPVPHKENDNSELNEFELDHPLLGPPDEIVEPPVDPQLEYLPTDQMSWENFERLLLRVAQDVRGLRSVRRYGTPGQAQKGLDVIGVNNYDKAEGIQSKRRNSFTKNDLDNAVKKYTEAASSSDSATRQQQRTAGTFTARAEYSRNP